MYSPRSPLRTAREMQRFPLHSQSALKLFFHDVMRGAPMRVIEEADEHELESPQTSAPLSHAFLLPVFLALFSSHLVVLNLPPKKGARANETEQEKQQRSSERRLRTWRLFFFEFAHACHSDNGFILTSSKETKKKRFQKTL